MKTLTEAAKHIAYDNGAINRLTTEEEVVKKMLDAADKHHDDITLVNTEHFLSTLTDEDLETLCAGEEGAVDAPPYVHDVLNTMFDNM